MTKKCCFEGARIGVVDGVFGRKSRNAVKAFQSQNLDPNGQHLVVDMFGVAGSDQANALI